MVKRSLFELFVYSILLIAVSSNVSAQDNHSVSEEGLNFIAEHEGLRYNLYNDPGGHCTIGIGHLVHIGNCNGVDSCEQEFLRGITRERALELFRADLAEAEQVVNTYVTVSLTQAQFDALVSFAYNVGSGNFRNSALLSKLNAGLYQDVPAELNLWVYSGSTRLPGLVTRRHDEGALFQQGTYAAIGLVTLTLYVHDGSADGPVLSGAEVTGQDAAGTSFSQTTDANGMVAIAGSPGNWQFSVTKAGYAANSWSQEITGTCTKHAYLFAGGSTQAPVEEWNRTFGGPGDDRAGSVLSTSNGDYIIGGGTASFGSAGEEAWLIKTDADGNELWNNIYGGDAEGGAYCLQLAEDGGFFANIYKCGYGLWPEHPEIYAYNASIVKTDPQGNEVWRKDGVAIKPISNGGWILVSDVDEGTRLVRTDEQGHDIWEKTIDGSFCISSDSVQITPDHGIIIAAFNDSYDAEIQKHKHNWLLTIINAGGGEAWKRNIDLGEETREIDCFHCPIIYPTADGGYIIEGGANFSMDNNHGKNWLIKTDALGNEIWRKNFDRYKDALLMPTSDGGCILACTNYEKSSIAKDSDSLLIKTDAQGNVVWSKTFDGTINDIQLASGGGYILAWMKESDDNGSSISWLTRIDTEGNEVWNTAFNGEIYEILSISSGGYILAGSTESFGAGGSDAWLIKLAPA